MSIELKIRKEEPKDYDAIYELVKLAFRAAEHSDGDEQDLVVRLRSNDAYIPELALLAEQDGKILGYIMLTIINIGQVPALALGPVAVLPKTQGNGIGGALIKEAHKIAAGLGYEFSVLLGHETYYPRFGYVRASTLGIKPPFEVPDENYMAYNLQGKNTHLDGVVKYPKPWGIN